jgi:hypothetical protein
MKIRKFRAGEEVSEISNSTSDSADKAAGLAASNAEKKSSGFLGLGRLFQGNIDEKGSEAYEQYGAGYGRKVEAKNDQLKAATLKAAADDEARAAEDARSEARIKAADKKIAEIRERANKSDIVDMKKSANSAESSAPVKASASTGSGSGSGATTPDKNDKGARSGSTPVKASAPAASGSDYRGPMQRMKLDVSNAAGPSAAAAAARSAAAAKAAADASKVRNPETDEGEDVRPASQAQLRALAAIAKATGSTSGVASGRVTAAEAARNIAEAAKKAGDTASSFVDNFKIETIADRRSRLAKEAKAKETASFNRERGDRATGGVIKSYAKGGSVSASSRGDGIAQRGKTRGRMC